MIERKFRVKPFMVDRLPAGLGGLLRSILGDNPVLVAGAAVLCALIALPIISVLSNVFRSSNGTIAHLAATILPEILFDTLGLLVMVGAGTAIVGTVCAWLVTMYVFPGSRAFGWFLLLPMAMPGYIIGYAYTDFLNYTGPIQSALRGWFNWGRGDYWFPEIRSLPGVSLLLTLVLYPYVYFLARTAFQDQSSTALDVARTLGHGGRDRFFRVALPLARPAIAAGLALALMEALADFGTVQYFGINTFTTAIYRTWFGMGDRVAAGQLASGLLVFVAALVVLEQWARRQGRVHRTGSKDRVVIPVALAGWRAGAAFVLCALPALLGFVVPVGILLQLHFQGGDDLFGGRFIRLAVTTFGLAGVAAVVVTAAGLFVAYAMRLARANSARMLLRLATFGYAVPGTVIAVGVLAPLGAFDNALDASMQRVFGVSTGLLFSGTVGALLFAYLVRFLAIASSSLDAGLGRIPTNMDQAARTLGCTTAQVMRRVHFPLLGRSVLTAGLLVFVDVLKELPATLIIRPFNFDTLAIRVYQMASDERLAQASTGALVIVVIGLVSVGILSGLMGRAERHR